jgi:hypothetical protein
MFDNKTDTINRIIKYGIYRLSKGIEYDLTNVARQTIYHIYRGEINSQIRRLMQNHVFERIWVTIRGQQTKMEYIRKPG